MHDEQATCDHCQRPRRDLRTHLLPLTLRPDGRGKRISDNAQSLVLCGACGDKRQQDLRAFFAGQAPTELVCPGRSR